MHAQNKQFGGQTIQIIISSGILLKQEETPTGQTENFGLNACLLSKVVLPIAAYKRNTPSTRGRKDERSLVFIEKPHGERYQSPPLNPSFTTHTRDTLHIQKNKQTTTDTATLN